MAEGASRDGNRRFRDRAAGVLPEHFREGLRGLYCSSIGMGTYLGTGLLNRANPAAERQLAAAAANGAWLDNAAGYYKLSVSAGDNLLVDVPASNDPREALQKISQSLPQQVVYL